MGQGSRSDTQVCSRPNHFATVPYCTLQPFFNDFSHHINGPPDAAEGPRGGALVGHVLDPLWGGENTTSSATSMARALMSPWRVRPILRACTRARERKLASLTEQFPPSLTTEQFPPSLAQCLTCSKMGANKKPSQFKLQDNGVGLIFRSALAEELEWETRAEDVALSLDAIKRCLSNMLVALDRDTPQTKNGLALLINFSTQELIINQEPPWLWFTLPELGFPLLTDEYRRQIHPEIEEYMRRYV